MNGSLREPAYRQIRIGGVNIDPVEVEAALLEHSSVDDCTVLVRETGNNNQELVAYIVTIGPLSLEQLKSHLQSVLPAASHPSAYIPVSHLPLTPTGRVDEQTLASLEVIDSDVVRRWEEVLQSIPGVEKVAVVVQRQPEVARPLHLSDLLPGSNSASSRALDHRAEIGAVKSISELEKSDSRSLALVDGESLPAQIHIPTALSETLRRAVLQSPEKGVMYIQSNESEIFQSYPALLEEAERVLAGLRKLGLKPQDKVIFQFEECRDFVTAFWGCVLGGFVAAPISVAPNYQEQNATVNKLQNAWQMLDRSIVLTSESLAPRVRSMSDFLKLDNFRVVTINDLLVNDRDRDWHESRTHDLALLMFTSGSTGLPKGVMLSHYNLLSRSAGSAQINGFSSEDVTLNWMPLDHVAGIIYFHLRDVFLGCQQVHAPTQLVLHDSLKWLDWIDRFRATITFAPNFAYGLVNDRQDEIAQRHWDLSSMGFILNGAEAIVAKTARKFLQLLSLHGLPTTAMVPAWGMSETSSGVTYSNSFSLDSTKDDDAFVEVGTPIPGLSMRIVNSEGHIMTEGAIGHLEVKGTTVTHGYYNNPELNLEAFTSDGWFKTGDLGFLRRRRLTLTGREKDVIIVNSVNYYSHEIEGVVEQIDGVTTSYTAACAVRVPNVDTDKLAIFFHPISFGNDSLIALLQKIRKEVVKKIGVTPDYLIPVEVHDIPKTEIGKIQRLQLSQRFAAGEFDTIRARIDILTDNSNTIPGWFYRKVWRRKEALPLHIQRRAGHALILLDSIGLGTRLYEEMHRLNRPCVRVEMSSSFAKVADDLYRIDPNNPDHYRRLLTSVEAENIRIDKILHLWTYDEYAAEPASVEMLERSQDRGVYSLLFLAQALALDPGDESPIQLYVISTHAQPIFPEDEIAYEKSPIVGLIKTIPREMPWINCRHVDLLPDKIEANAGRVLRELVTLTGDREVAYRNGQRWLPRLEKANFLQEEKVEPPFKHGGMYLLSGGLGGIGVEIAKFLLQRYEARLLLVGRTPMPAAASDNEGEQEHVGRERFEAYHSLQQLGGEVLYEKVDICDDVQLRRVVERAKASWRCELDGVVHLAGVYRECLLTKETRASFAATLRPKLVGTWALHQLIKDQPHSVFISFSSVTGFFGGFAVGAYASANAFLDCFVHYQRRKHSLQSYCLAWSLWDEVGISRGYRMENQSRVRGYCAISMNQGINSFLIGLHHAPGLLLIGLDGGNPQVRRLAEGDSFRVEKLAGYFTGLVSQENIDKFQELLARDRFGTRCVCEFRQIPKMPLTEKGEIDRDSLLAMSDGSGRKATEKIGPTTELEQTIASIWQDVLNKKNLAISENFFDLGGTSLLMARINGKLREIIRKDISMPEMFQHPTIGALAEFLDSTRNKQQSSELEHGKMRGANRRERTRRRKQSLPIK